MRSLIRLLPGLILFCMVLTGVHARSKVLRPSKDDFYTPPPGFENEKPGAILKSRTLPHNSLAVASVFRQNLESVYQILYRTSDGLGAPVATVTTLFVPYGADPLKLVSYQAAEDSSAIDCAPSYTYQSGSSFSDAFIQAEPLFMASYFRRGWSVSVPDYEGPKALFGVGAMAGKATLDGIRAVLSSCSFTKIDPMADVQMWGYSGGSIPTGWATELHPSYAPELNIVGAVLGGVVVSPNGTMNTINQQDEKGLVFPFYRGLANQYPDMAAYLDSVIKPEKRKDYDRVNDLCLTGIMREYKKDDLSTYFSEPDYVNHPTVKKALEENVMGQLDTPTIPLFMLHMEFDKLAPFSEVKELYSRWCDGGASIQFNIDASSAHTTHLLLGAPDALLFMESRFDKKPIQKGCSTTGKSLSKIDSHSLSALGSLLWNAWVGLNGIRLGAKNP
ncbi:hypothetical protein [Absidia glauca]|uniref:Lipase n=1 Tax=Absidia glauca TaxID=4829 RepID=A0A168MYW8_ABSGL|nr:hypothetical protein [Absidia glauca]